jgi:hypothetical protein
VGEDFSVHINVKNIVVVIPWTNNTMPKKKN